MTFTPHVLIVTDYGFPHGSGSSSRIFNYARGLQAAGARVKVLCVEAAYRSDTLNTAAGGEFRGVPFEYSSGRTTRPGTFAGRRAFDLLKWPRFAVAIRRWATREGGLDAMIVYTRSPVWIALAWAGCRRLDALLLHEDCELPFVWRRGTARNRLSRRLYEDLVFRTFDGCLVISTYLDAYCRRHLRPEARTLLVPILVDVYEVASDDEVAGEPSDNVAYCGYMDHREVRAVVDAFAAVAADFPKLRLQLIGGWLRPEHRPELEARLERLGLAGRVELTGRVTREELFGLLREARVQLLPRAAAAFSDAGLPTKVAEYLAAGRPVVTTAVGDLPLYLTDGVDAYLADPYEPAVFAARLRDALDHPAEAAAIGRRGRETARERFDPATQGRRIVAYIRELGEMRAGRRGPRPDDAARVVGDGQ